MMLRRVTLGVAAIATVTAQLANAQGVPAVATANAYQPTDKDERGLWMQMDEQERDLKNSNFVIRDPALNAYVRGVFCRVVGPRCSEVRLYITRTAYFNANIAPNGMMQVWSGLLLRTRNEAQLAAVLGHEYAHYQNHHTLQLFRQMRSRAAGAAWMSMFGLVGSLLALGQISAIFKFSREQEAEADRLSVGMIAGAGYDPREVPKIWEQFRAEMDATAAARGTKSRKDKDRGLFASHPPTAERVAALTAEAGRLPVDPAWRTGEAGYRHALAVSWPGFIDDQIKLNDFGGTEFLIAYLARDGWTGSLNFARGELYRSRGRPDDLTAAAGFYKSATAAPDGPIESWRGLGLSLLRTGDQPGGQAAIKTYLTRKPDASDKAMLGMLAGVTQ